MRALTNIALIGFIASLSFILVACSDQTDETANIDEAKGDHIWKQQTDTLQSAKDSVKKMQKSLEQQQESMDENK